MTTYNADYFIKKFTAIPEVFWNTKTYRSLDGMRQCAFGFCGCGLPPKKGVLNSIDTPESEALLTLFMNNGLGPVSGVNDGYDRAYRQSTPRARILAALEDIKKKGY